MQTSEGSARVDLDQQLTAAGLAVQGVNELNLSAQRGVAVREFPTATGPADYLLFADRKAIGVVETKKEGTTLSVGHDQGSKYGTSKTKHIERWAAPLPFIYESTGIETLFTDERAPDARARPLLGFHRPEHLVKPVQRTDTLRDRLKTFPKLDTAPLRDCQIATNTRSEESFADNRPRALLQMATGSGKTYTAVTLTYRHIKHAGAKRILFLVDRGNLGRQTVKKFQNDTSPDDGRKFTDLYNVQRLGPAGIDPVCKVTVSTNQRLYAQLMDNEMDEDADEHSGYISASAQTRVAKVTKVSAASHLSSPTLETLNQSTHTAFQFYDEQAENSNLAGAYLLHWLQGGVICFVTFRLADSLPQEKLKSLTEERERWLEQNPEPHTPTQQSEYHKRFSQQLEQWLDLGYGSMILQDPDAKRLVRDANTHFNTDRYKLDEYVVAAYHVHFLVPPKGKHTLSDILHSWKSFTAKELLKLPLAEQLQIVAKVEASTTAIDHLETEFDSQIVRSDRLRQSTLSEAFTGTL